MKRAFLLTICLLLALAACGGNLRVHLIGDSTCATKELSKQNPERGWGQLFQPLFDGSVTIRNHAVNGRSTKSFRDEGRWQRVCDELRPGDYVFIQFGHNDQKRFGPLRLSGTVCREPAPAARTRRARGGAVPVLLTPVVRRRFTDGVPDDTHAPLCRRRAACGRRSRCSSDRRRAADPRMGVAARGRSVESLLYVGRAGNQSPLARRAAGRHPFQRPRRPRRGADDRRHSFRSRFPELGRRLKASDFVVAQDGSGDFLSLAEAVAAVPDFCRDTTRILVCEGIYREKIVVPTPPGAMSCWRAGR
ncbi:MAG: GDSL-type esterase/lipase family protein [Alistipes shahii]|uniref:GDSL-type esterase/lipase family protein n=1 Tax=Alistipes shahii TaxID=328814 RepID=UPI00399D5436